MTNGKDALQKLNIAYPIIVEGKYDKQRILEVCNATVIATDGFGIFKKSEKLALLRRLAEKTPLIVLTDSDGAGKVIRSHISSAVPKDRLIQLYIPQIKGKEKRKSEPSAEGTLGVEGMEREVIERLFAPFDTKNTAPPRGEEVTRLDFYEAGLLGGAGAKEKRAALCRRLELPPLSSGALLGAVNILLSREEFLRLLKEAQNEAQGN